MKNVKKAVTFLFALTIIVSVFFGIVTFSVRSELRSASVLAVKIADDEYMDALCSRVNESVKRKLALVVITPEQLASYLDAAALRDEAVTALSSTVNCVFGNDFETYEYKNSDLRSTVESVLREYSEENEVVFADDSVDKVYDMLCETITDELRVVPEKYATKAAKYAAKIDAVCELFFAFLPLYAISVAVILILGRRRMRGALYNVLLPSYLGAFFAFAVSSVLISKDYLSATILKNETFQHVLRSVYRYVLSDMKQLSLVLTLAFAASSAVIIVTLSVKRHRRSNHSKKDLT